MLQDGLGQLPPDGPEHPLPTANGQLSPAMHTHIYVRASHRNNLGFPQSRETIQPKLPAAPMSHVFKHGIQSQDLGPTHHTTVPM